MDDGTGVPLAAGVLEVDSDLLSPFELAAIGRVFEVADEESFEGDSSLTGAAANFPNASGDSFSLTIMELFDDFRRAIAGVAGAGLFAEAIVRIAMMMTRMMVMSVKKFKIARRRLRVLWVPASDTCNSPEWW
jgi:hypothetical protein